eukprot:scaffold51_cov401-Prasinococcus_capsulatus_cf.AAC.46
MSCDAGALPALGCHSQDSLPVAAPTAPARLAASEHRERNGLPHTRLLPASRPVPLSGSASDTPRGGDWAHGRGLRGALPSKLRNTGLQFEPGAVPVQYAQGAASAGQPPRAAAVRVPGGKEYLAVCELHREVKPFGDGGDQVEILEARDATK